MFHLNGNTLSHSSPRGRRCAGVTPTFPTPHPFLRQQSLSQLPPPAFPFRAAPTHASYQPSPTNTAFMTLGSDICVAKSRADSCHLPQITEAIPGALGLSHRGMQLFRPPNSVPNSSVALHMVTGAGFSSPPILKCSCSRNREALLVLN